MIFADVLFVFFYIKYKSSGVAFYFSILFCLLIGGVKVID
jgi:hypothetical protein